MIGALRLPVVARRSIGKHFTVRLARLGNAGLDTKLDDLRRLRLFSDCRRHDLKLIASVADEALVDAGTVLARKGSFARQFIIVAEGSARGEGHMYGPGDFFGFEAGLPRTAWTETVVAATPMQIYTLPSRAMPAVLFGLPSVATRLNRHLAGELYARNGGEANGAHVLRTTNGFA